MIHWFVSEEWNMTKKRFMWVLFTLCTPVMSLQAGLLINGDFNTGEYLPEWWLWAADQTNQSGQIEPGTGYSYDGTPNIKLWSASSTWAMMLGQEFAIAEKTPYSLSLVYSARWTDSWGSAGISVDYYDADWKYIGFEWVSLYNQQPGPNADGQWLSYSGTFTAPAGTANASLKIKAADWTTVYFDNVDVSIIPEPATLLLLGLGGFVLRRRSA